MAKRKTTRRKSSRKTTGKRRKAIKVNLGKKGSFTIKKPGAFRAKAKRAGMSTKAFAAKVLRNPGSYSKQTVRQARSAKGLMAMGKKRKKK